MVLSRKKMPEEIEFKPTTNADFEYGKYGPLDVLFMKGNGYINATSLCKQTNRRFDNWLRNKESGELVRAFIEGSPQIRGDPLTIVQEGDNAFRGTYVHRYLITHIAAWCSPEFGMRLIASLAAIFAMYMSTPG